jgi:hypothetical protein
MNGVPKNESVSFHKGVVSAHRSNSRSLPLGTADTQALINSIVSLIGSGRSKQASVCRSKSIQVSEQEHTVC